MNANETILRSLIAHDDEWERLYQQELAALLAIMDEAHDRALSGIATLWGKVAETKEHIDATYAEAAKRVKARLDADMPSVGKDESAYIRVLIGEVAQGVALKSSKILWAEVVKLPAASGLTLYQLADNMAVDNIADVVTTIQQGLQAQKTLAEVVRELRGSVVTRAKWVKGKYVPGVYDGGVMTTDTRETEMFARTAIMHVGNSARDAFYEANADIVKAYMRVEVLDERTCIECGIADGRTYKVDEPRPSLPAHPACRGFHAPILKSYRELGVDIDELPAGVRASMDGAVPQYKTWRDVVAEGSPARQAAILGPTRARLYRNGMKLDSFVKDGKLVPIKELVK